jgi:hypothetical protein
MKTSKIKLIQFLVAMALCCTFIIGNLFVSGSLVEAATKKTAISTTSMTIPVGKLDSKVYWNGNPWERSNGQKLTVKNTIKGATYQFTSSNTKVVTISKNGGYLTGTKAGSATITVTQTYKKKKTTIGKCKVTVKNASLTVSNYGNEFPIGDGGFDLSSYYGYSDPLFNIAYRNPKATYTLTSSSNDFSVKEVKYDASKAKTVTDSKEYQEVLQNFIGDGYFYGYQYSAKKAGTYTITVKETYNKNTRTLGSFKVVIEDTSIAEAKVDMLLGDSLNCFNLISYPKANSLYYFSVKGFDEANVDNNVIGIVQGESELYIKANKVGTAEVTVIEGSENGTVIGTVTIAVAEAPCQSITLESQEYTTYVDDYFYIDYELDPWDTTDKVTIESNNPEVLKVEYNEEYQSWTYSPLKVGEANVTIKCGNQSAVCKVVVEEW